MTQATIHEAKTYLSKLIEKALAGEDVVIAKDGLPLVRLVPILGQQRKPRFGGWQGEFWMAEDFDAELAEFEDHMAPSGCCSTPTR